ncbi:LCP family protein [Streptomyces sp. ST2-7A]|uniref:LCP family protein n=1 Tax=Streptomyces sp. ST2-7A TaxID=2907214 RepID=UPI001F18C07D|nr:LCP family protein [Streptomyces sp. ST2-7A]MCE7083495.1 LCP family protein [Streptomyces sp. ST2-7A]
MGADRNGTTSRELTMAARDTHGVDGVGTTDGERRSRRVGGRRAAIGRRIAAGVLVAAVVAGGAGAWLHHRLGAGLGSVDLSLDVPGPPDPPAAPGDGGGRAGEPRAEGAPEPEAEAGRSLLVVAADGGDGRTAGSDGGTEGTAEGTARHAVMVVRLPEGGPARALVVPRELEVPTPTCARPPVREHPPWPAAGYSHLTDIRDAGGPACLARAVEKVVEDRMDHYLEVDVARLGDLVDALEGIDLRTPVDLRDPASGREWPAGTHRLDGVGATAAARSLGEPAADGLEPSQRVLLAVLREIERRGVLSSPAALYRVAEAASDALTTDKGLGSITELVRFAKELGSTGSGLRVRALPLPGTDPAAAPAPDGDSGTDDRSEEAREGEETGAAGR